MDDLLAQVPPKQSVVDPRWALITRCTGAQIAAVSKTVTPRGKAKAAAAKAKARNASRSLSNLNAGVDKAQVARASACHATRVLPTLQTTPLFLVLGLAPGPAPQKLRQGPDPGPGLAPTLDPRSRAQALDHPENNKT